MRADREISLHLRKQRGADGRRNRVAPRFQRHAPEAEIGEDPAGRDRLSRRDRESIRTSSPVALPSSPDSGARHPAADLGLGR